MDKFIAAAAADIRGTTEIRAVYRKVFAYFAAITAIRELIALSSAPFIEIGLASDALDDDLRVARAVISQTGFEQLDRLETTAV